MPGVGVMPSVQTAAPINPVSGFNGGGDFSPFGGGNDAAGVLLIQQKIYHLKIKVS